PPVPQYVPAHQDEPAADAPAGDAPPETELQRERRWRGIIQDALETFVQQ
ncbi:hypothetical protein A2U01_0107556, partial [Trifolium medium]|nr:hypothetical protein [Trifolium medium]